VHIVHPTQGNKLILAPLKLKDERNPKVDEFSKLIRSLSKLKDEKNPKVDELKKTL
jgi:uncharacterized coiled-coil DUF342 family protein